MKIEVLKAEFHDLIDHIDDPELLMQFFDAINTSIKPDNYSWLSLSPQRRQEILDAYEESEDDANLVSLADIKLKYNKWPLK